LLPGNIEAWVSVFHQHRTKIIFLRLKEYLPFNLTGTLIQPIYWQCCTEQTIVIEEKYIDDEYEEDFDMARKADS
jgi:hypothetical protein